MSDALEKIYPEFQILLHKSFLPSCINSYDFPGLRAYIGARSAHEAKTAVMDSKDSGLSTPNGEFVNREGNDEFHDAVGTDSSLSSSSSSDDDDDSDNEVELNSKVTKARLHDTHDKCRQTIKA